MSAIQTVIDIIQTLIPLSVSLGTGLLGSWLFFKPKIGQRDEYIEELEKSTKKYAKQLNDKNQSLIEHETTIKKLKEEQLQKGIMINQATLKISELSDRSEELIPARARELSDRSKELISEKNSYLETLNNTLKNQEQNILELTKRAQEIESIEKKQRLELNQRVEALIVLQNQLQERNDQKISLKDELADLAIRTQNTIMERESHIDKLTSSIEINEDKIDNLTEHLRARADLQEQIKKIITRAENFEAREIKMGNALKTKDLKDVSLHQRTRRMQDDFTHILGIGQKISSILINAGIKSFSKLATTEVNHIRDILEKENPALLKLSDPTTWPEQARLAAEGDWDALSNLQNSIKASKTRPSPVETEIEMEPLPAES
jgi:predicted flap endonuclease-1-like 5' DNA nuclease